MTETRRKGEGMSHPIQGDRKLGLGKDLAFFFFFLIKEFYFDLFHFVLFK